MFRSLFKNCSIFDGFSDVLLQHQYVVIEDSLIQDVTPDRPSGDFDSETDVRGMTLMPGLIDAHVHVNVHKTSIAASDELDTTTRALHSNVFMEAALQRGFTSLRDAGGAERALYNGVENGLIRGPRLFFSGKAISQTGGHGDFRRPHQFESCACSYSGSISRLADGVDEMRKAVREELRYGAHQIKIMASGGVASPSDPIWMCQYTEDEIRAAVEEAARHQTYVMAHAYTPEAISRCIRLGIRSIEHGNLIDEATANLVREHDAFVVPTLSTYHALAAHGGRWGFPEESLAKVSEVKDSGLRALEILMQNNVKIGFGSDLLGDLHVYQCDEFLIRSEVQRPFDILRSATSINAELLNMADRLGCVKPGAIADLIVVDGNPLEDLSCFTADGAHVCLIMKDGKVYKDTLSAVR
ncbi:metal-dependent hydrolase family protein [Halioxenophilus sp. WMMB6]|uniref:metal-dependent hydrolase family protein n=1 Tax=Halioxenophilus sp. WMMB6 TaxID=3073815 RepID=UPI00295F3382|nr:amidohydrolase family protein [Halioxenophilus sp. WMMB6]